MRFAAEQRNRNIDMYDAIAYKLYYSNSNTTQEEAVIKVNSASQHSDPITSAQGRLAASPKQKGAAHTC